MTSTGDPAPTRAAVRVAGPTREALKVAEAAAAAAPAVRPDVAVETVQREATRVWARVHRRRLGLTETFSEGALAWGLVERRTIKGYRTRYPMWQKVLYSVESAGLSTTRAAELIGVDEEDVAIELPIARKLRDLQ